jgi:hypothetical protein
MVGMVSAPLLVFALAVAATAEGPPRLTSDSPEYCASLTARLAGMPAARREPSRSLAAEGTRLCGSGHPQAGIAKLRRAVKAATAEAP